MNEGEEGKHVFLQDENPTEPQKTDIADNGVKTRYQSKFSNRSSVSKNSISICWT